MGGTFSGGTYHSAINAMARIRQSVQAARERKRREQRPQGRRIHGAAGKPHRSDVARGWVVPFPTIDPQTVLRSAAALERYGPDFSYSHYLVAKRLPVLVGLAAGAGGAVALAQLPPTRKLLLKIKDPGEGPTPEQRAKAWFRVRLVGEGGGKRVLTEVSGGDPGYGETSKMLAESALCLAHDELPPTAGQVTPAAAMGDALIARLTRAGIAFTVVETTDMTVTPQQATDVANAAYGRHPGYRALHAKGTLLKGTFTASPEAATLTRAAHMQGDPVPATVRVSNGGGNPQIPDYAPDVRGLAVKLYLPDGSRTDIVAQTAPKFIGSTPDTFLDLLRAQGPGASVAWKFPLFLLRNPGAIARLPANLPALRPPVSYATCTYYAVHAYRWVDAHGAAQYVRYTWQARRRASSTSARARRGHAGATTSRRTSAGGSSRDRSASRSSSSSRRAATIPDDPSARLAEGPPAGRLPARSS